MHADQAHMISPPDETMRHSAFFPHTTTAGNGCVLAEAVVVMIGIHENPSKDGTIDRGIRRHLPTRQQLEYPRLLVTKLGRHMAEGEQPLPPTHLPVDFSLRTPVAAACVVPGDGLPMTQSDRRSTAA